MNRSAASDDGIRSQTVLDDLPLYLPRLFYSFLGVVELKLAESGLGKDLQPGMPHVLLRLYEQDDCIIKDLSRSLRIANATMTGLLARMQKAGLVECRRCSEDGRAVRIRLTPRGHALKPRVRRFHADITRIVEQGLTPEQVDAGKQLMARMMISLRDADESLRLRSVATLPRSKRPSAPKRKTLNRTSP